MYMISVKPVSTSWFFLYEANVFAAKTINNKKCKKNAKNKI